ncbi:MAG TPA: glycosyltransferase family 9 protein [Candidatus Krumholzibacteria bacterium]|nr:glycosyltransferase family 9 protein [Candidatus Krumholzibacteria bacterium]
MTAPIALGAGDRVLVTRLNYLGDVVLSLAMVDALRRAHPGIEIDYLTREPAASLLRPDARFARVFGWRDGMRAALSMVATLRSRRYRAVIDLYSNPRSAWLSWLSGAPVRIGGNRRGRRLLYTHRVQPPAGTPVIDVFMEYAKPLGVNGPPTKPVLAITAHERDDAQAHLENAGAAASVRTPRIGVHPGGKWSVKRWPAAHFAELVDRLEKAGARVVVFTGPDERDATDEVMRRVTTSPARLEPLDIRATAAVISCLDAMVACDGGIMHTSVATGTPTVGIFGSSQSSVWFPYENFGPYRAAQIDVPCRPCHQHVCPLGHTRCLNELSPARVASILEPLLDTRRLAT